LIVEASKDVLVWTAPRHRVPDVGRQQREGFFAKLPLTYLVLEACGGSHHWGLTALERRVQLDPAAMLKPFIKRNKKDRADAEAIREAAARPGINFAPVKSAEQQAAAMVLSVSCTGSPPVMALIRAPAHGRPSSVS
jgi:transposase